MSVYAFMVCLRGREMWVRKRDHVLAKARASCVNASSYGISLAWFSSMVGEKAFCYDIAIDNC